MPVFLTLPLCLFLCLYRAASLPVGSAHRSPTDVSALFFFNAVFQLFRLTPSHLLLPQSHIPYCCLSFDLLPGEQFFFFFRQKCTGGVLAADQTGVLMQVRKLHCL